MTMRVLVSTACLLAALVAPAEAYQRPWRTELISQSTAGQPADGDSRPYLSISPDGRYVAFASEATDLAGQKRSMVPGTGETPNVFVRDRKTGRTDLVSVTSAGTLGDVKSLGSSLGGSSQPRITPSGRYVAFSSTYPLADEDLDIFSDVFVHDRVLRKTELISVRGDEPMIGARPAITPDARYVAFEGGTPVLGTTGILRRDRRRGVTDLVTVNIDGDPIDASAPSISADGRFIVFTSSAERVVDSTVPTVGSHVYVRDMKTQKTELISKDIDGNPANSPVTRGSITYFGTDHISADGRFVLFSSHADPIVPNDHRTIATYPEIVDIFVRDRKLDRVHRVTVDSAGEDMFGNLESPSLSPDGRFVVFKRDSTDASLTAMGGCPDTCHGLYAHDLETGATEPVGPMHDSYVDTPVISAGGRYVAFVGASDVWHGDDSNGYGDVFLHDRGTLLSVGQLVADGDTGEITIREAPRFATGGLAAFEDAAGDPIASGSIRNADLIGFRIAHRPRLSDLFVTLELAHLDPTPSLATTTAGMLYGASFTIGGRSYEVRATSTGIGQRGETTAEFGLYRCPPAAILCTKVANLHGGFGTTGPRIHMSIPLRHLELGGRNVMSDLEAFAAIGSGITGTMRVLDNWRLR